MKALIFAAGKGTRLKPFTDRHPKALVSVNGVPVLQRNIRYLQSFGINEFVINVHHFADQIVNFLTKHQNFGAQIEISDEKEELLETGGGLLHARKFLDGTDDFLIINADILTDLNLNDLITFHRQNGGFATLAVSERDSSRKLLFDDEMILRGWRNVTTGEARFADQKQELRDYAFSGIHCVNPKVFNMIRRRGKFSIMEEYLDLMKEEKIYGYLHQAQFMDVGTPESVRAAEKIFL